MGNNLIEIKDFPTRKVMKREKKIMNSKGFRALHTDFINNVYHVTFVNGTDDHVNPEQKEIDVKRALQELLVENIQRDTITWKDYKILQRLERDLELQQSTIDKLVIIKQGGLRGILQRIRDLFNL